MAPATTKADPSESATASTGDAADPLADATDVEDLNIQDLLAMPITTASKREESIQESASVVSVITREDIQSFGGLTLDERLSYLAGVELIETYFGYGSVTFRGNMQTHYNNKSLFLINGHPLFTPVTGSFFLAQIPETAIDRVEVVRGPGSTLYGTNAYAGVINVITRTPKKKDFWEAHALGGSYATNQLGVAAGKSFGDFDLYLFGSHHDSNGYPFKVKEDEAKKGGVPQTVQDFYAFEEDRDSIYGGLSFGGLTVNAGYFKEKRDKFGLIPKLSTAGPSYRDGWMGDLTYRFALDENQDLAIFVRHDGYSLRELVGVFGTPGVAAPQSTKLRWLGHKTGAEVQYGGLFTLMDDALKLSLTLGGTFDFYKTEPYEFRFTEQAFDADGDLVGNAGEAWANANAYADQYDFYDASGYLNVDVTGWGLVKLAGGLRYNYNSDYGSFLAPRLGLVGLLTKQLSVKLLYGRAYRAPNFFEKYVTTFNVLYGGDLDYDAGGERFDNSLVPEIIDTMDLAVEWREKSYTARLVGYYLMTNDSIGRGAVIPADSSLGNAAQTPAYANSEDKATIYGVEFDAEARVASSLRVFLNGTWRKGTSESEAGETADLPYWFAPYLFNLGGSYRASEWLAVSVYGQFVGPRALTVDPPAGSPAGTPGTEHEFDPYALVNAQVTVEPYAGVELALIAKNILDTEYSYPEYVRHKIAEVPGGAGRTFFGRLRMSF